MDHPDEDRRFKDWMVKVIWSHNSSTACYLGILKNSCFRLNSQGEIYIDWKILWIEYSCQKRAKGGLTDVWTLIPDFTLHEQANLRRSGVGKLSPVLDQEKLDLLRGGIREGLLIAEHSAIVDVISKKFALPISTVEEKMRWALRRLRVMYCGENI
ncbi:hypothetical protein DPMN_119436 [Dreissena polymorpha]|uniref:Uncharacterized protein n=1 Tax=Dreissena polymorpha TaxID=45954 RepID=A0A9D4JMT3_DREPO|nr:hypothetical protein DPMN_119436 [Dreissena polymorpha]